ncbi:ABC transporter ATP-binding protein [Anaerococcus provencensis]|uniref:ABC transporter ATP-binding protein n=1 Tax=Anaerococcus provencensis TaxID=938293 RepID=UPI00030D08BC|nr:ABC transporter ATP-binding protein [Anaerococcus provencensis]
MSEITVKIEDLSVIYDNGDGVKNINLNIHNNEIVTLLGPSGCGKSTILRALGGFNPVSSGHIYIEGIDVTNIAPENRPTSMVFQGYNLWPHMTVYENLAYGLKLRKVDKKIIDSEIENILKLLKMVGFEKKYPSQMSGGQQQRIAIGRSLLLKPAVLLLDEPFSALDAKIRQQMRAELRRIQQELGISVVFVTHDQEEAISISDRIVVMDKGVISQIDTPENIYENPINPYVASFIGEMNFIDDGNEVKAFRPEETHVYTDNTGKYLGEVTQIMLMGHYYQLRILVNDKEFLSFVPKNLISDIKLKDKVSFDITNYRIYNKEN